MPQGRFADGFKAVKCGYHDGIRQSKHVRGAKRCSTAKKESIKSQYLLKKYISVEKKN